MSTTQVTVPVAESGWGTRILQFPLTRIIFPILLLGVTLFGTSTLIRTLVPDKSMRIGWPYPIIVSIFFGVYYLYVRFIEKREINEFSRPGALRELAGGLVWGCILMSSVMGMLAVCGAYHVTGQNAWTVVLAPIGEMALVALMEEIVFRGILFRVIEKSLGTWVALLLSSVLFAAAHLGNEGVSALGVLNVAMAGALLASAYILTQRLWFAIGMHFAWNYALTAVFSVTVSGHPGVGLLQSNVSGPEWLTGGEFGVEASVVAIVVISTAAVYFIKTAKARNAFVLPFWKRAKLA
jgi:membrane protease YdiL (CAAX protease family)